MTHFAHKFNSKYLSELNFIKINEIRTVDYDIYDLLRHFKVRNFYMGLLNAPIWKIGTIKCTIFRGYLLFSFNKG